jgi:hypothetical protein
MGWLDVVPVMIQWWLGSSSTVAKWLSVDGPVPVWWWPGDGPMLT